MRKILILTNLVLLIVIGGCLPAEEVTSEPTMPTEEAVHTLDPYLAPEESNQEPYIGPQEPTLEPYVFQESKAGTVTVHGLLFVADPDQGMPDSNDAIFLVPLPESEGVTMMPNFEIGSVPQADVDERTGEFVFTDIEPGQYIVMVYTIHNSKIPARTEAGSFAIIRVEESDRDQIIEVNYLLVP